ncbi:glycosyltransferase [Georgenia muralis]|uniref:Glycosyltransferase involved in cell wall biosynthesis n=1 Tax=Georgenia muralis TaxID=154117 RepID=A0A3N4Z3Z4_9MICO|nr:glycosyltransferase [Georgenia muralis]RPF26396.1 glycosyltransferase involved in cell wall biosynthesis [Georgenia muralis]
MTDLVVVSLEAWDAVWRRNQYLVAGLLRADPALRVLFVEPPADPVHDVRRRSQPRPGAGLRPVRDLPGAEGRLWRLQATKLFPRRLDPGADARLAVAVERAATRLGFVEPVLWINDPGGATILRRTRWPALYDITDDWVAADRSAGEHARLLADEHVLLRRCREVVVCSPALVEAKGRTRPVTLIPNAVDVDAYRRPGDRPADLPMGRVALYLGTIHPDRMDLDLCVDTATALAGVGSLVLVGPALVDRATHRRLTGAGVILLGPKDRRSVASYLVHADVLVVPHVVDAFTDSLDPIKAYEYRAAGRPVVSTPVAGFREHAGHGVEIADRGEFAAVTRSALLDPEPRTVLDAEVPTWDDRAAQMAAVIERLDPPATGIAHGPSGPRVLFLNHSTEPGGAELALVRLLSVTGRTWRAGVLVAGPELGVFRALDRAPGALVMGTRGSMRAGISGGAVGRVLGAALEVIVEAVSVALHPAARTADILWANSTRSAVYGILASAILRKPLVVHLRDVVSVESLGWAGDLVMRRLVLPRATGVVANSAFTLASAAGVRLPAVTAVIRSPVGNVLPAPAAPVRAEVERVGMVARIARWKGQHLLIEAFARTFGGTPVSLHLAGGVLFDERAYRRELERLVSDLDVADQVVFEGHVEDVGLFIDSLDVCVQASTRPEPMGQNVLQYLARGRPTVVADEGGPSEVVEDGVNGRVFHARQVASLAGVLGELAADLPQRRRLGEHARQGAVSFRDGVVLGQVDAMLRRVAFS